MRRRVPSLRYRLMRTVLLPLAVAWLLGGGLVLGLARYFTQQAYDRAMLDDALVLAAHVRDTSSGLQLDLTPGEMGTLLFDQNETVYFSVHHQDGRLLAGHPALSLPEPIPTAPLFHAQTIRGQDLRVVALAQTRPGPFVVMVAQTTAVQDRRMARQALWMGGGLLVLLLLLAGWLRRVIGLSVQPLSVLERSMAERDVQDLQLVRVRAGTREVRRLAASLNSLLRRVARTVRSQKEFAGNVAHELRTPLAGIRALAEYGLQQQDPAVWREQLQKIAQSQERASHLIDQLLALALAQEARETLPPQSLRLDDLVQQSLLRHLPQADARGVDLGAQGLDAPVWVRAQAALLEGLLDNLIDNAMRYAQPPGGGIPAITVQIDTLPTGRVRLSVLDNGPGMPAAQREPLRQRWAQGQGVEPWQGGVGLGLAIVTEYARILQAPLSFDDAPGGGLAVHVDLLATSAPV